MDIKMMTKDDNTVALIENCKIRFKNWVNSIINTIQRKIYSGCPYHICRITLSKDILNFLEDNENYGQFDGFCMDLLEFGYEVRIYRNKENYQKYLFIGFADGDEYEFKKHYLYNKMNLIKDYKRDR